MQKGDIVTIEGFWEVIEVSKSGKYVRLEGGKGDYLVVPLDRLVIAPQPKDFASGVS